MNDLMTRDRDRHERTLIIFKELGITQREFTRKTGFSKSQWYAWFSSHRNSGTRLPSVDQFTKICQSYGISPTWILIGLGPRYLTDLKHNSLRDTFIDQFDKLALMVETIR